MLEYCPNVFLQEAFGGGEKGLWPKLSLRNALKSVGKLFNRKFKPLYKSHCSTYSHQIWQIRRIKHIWKHISDDHTFPSKEINKIVKNVGTFFPTYQIEHRLTAFLFPIQKFKFSQILYFAQFIQMFSDYKMSTVVLT